VKKAVAQLEAERHKARPYLTELDLTEFGLAIRSTALATLRTLVDPGCIDLICANARQQ
jgi:hypothetical protein